MNSKSTSYEQLLDYQKQGFVFHGSTNPNITTLEPKPATDTDKDNTFNNDTAIFATPLPSASVIFSCMSIDIALKEAGGGTWSVSQDKKGNIIAKIPKKWQPYVTNNSGHVYVLDSSSFPKIEETNGGWQVKSKQAVTPIAKVEVTFSDFEKLGGILFWKD